MRDAAASPTVKALLMTDMVDSTLVGARLGDEAMAQVWRMHDRMVRDLLRTWNGREIAKSDGVQALFDDVAHALGCALAYHRGMREAALPVRARAGIHLGPVTLRMNEPADVARGAKTMEVDGLAVSIAARVMATARGGQTLLSGSAAQALATEAAPALRGHGHWQLKGVDEPVELFEVAEPGTEGDAPEDGPRALRVTRQGDAWVPVSGIGHSLAAERDSFVGRRAELALLAGRLAEGARLVSVLGVGGTGKTRLVTRHARQALAAHPGGVWFCDLSQARTQDGIHFAVAQGLKMPLGRTEPAGELASAIAARGRCLVILDNFEQVVQHAEATLGRWLDAAPQARFVVTTREVLGIVGEEVLPLAPLNPGEGEALFIQRAQAASLGYLPGEADRAAIGQLVATLDGLPLAIELTAARVRAMPPAAMLDRLQSRLDLAHGGRGRVDRQATLRAAFDWSWELLAEDERAALAMLSVFEGGMSLDGAAAVLAPLNPGGSTAHIAVLLETLADKSLLQPVSGVPGRYRMLETVREYAAGQLCREGRFPDSGEMARIDAKRRHWRHFAQRQQLDPAMEVIEANNFVAACRAAAQAGDAAAATGCLVAAWAALRQVGPQRVALELAESVGALEQSRLADRGLVHWVASEAADMLGAADVARHHVVQGLSLASDEATEGHVRLLLSAGRYHTNVGELDTAQNALTGARDMAIALGHVRLHMQALNALGRHWDHQARWPAAQASYEQALALATSLGDRRMEGGLLGNLGGVAYDRGDLPVALELYERSLAIAQELGDKLWEGNAHSNLGLLRQEQGHADSAREHFSTALQRARQVGHAQLEYVVLCNLGILESAEGRHERAGECFGRAVDYARACADKRSEGQFLGYLAVNLARRGELEQAREALRSGEALLRSMEDKLSLALLLCDRAEVEAMAGCLADAERAVGKGRAIAAELRCGDDSELERRLRQATESAASRSPSH